MDLLPMLAVVIGPGALYLLVILPLITWTENRNRNKETP